MNLERLKKQLKFDEGWRSKMYLDTVGIPTIGYGRNLTKGISLEEGEFLLESDIAEALTALKKNLPWFDSLDDVRQEVLINMCFNMGWGTLSQFQRTLGFIERGEYDQAADAMVESKWYGQVGNRAQRLVYAMRNGKFE